MPWRLQAYGLRWLKICTGNSHWMPKRRHGGSLQGLQRWHQYPLNMSRAVLNGTTMCAVKHASINRQ